MINTITYQGPQPYREMWDRQREMFNALVTEKKVNQTGTEEYILLLEHEPVITLGIHGHKENLIAEDLTRARGIECIRIERGGDITYHGPGQLVGYVIVDLEKRHLGVKAFVNLLEEAVIRTISEYGVKGERVEGATGIWIDKGTDKERKICAIGVKCSRFVTMHGLALNVNTDLSAFNLINPCGFIDKGVTSLAKETGMPVKFEKVASRLGYHLNVLLES